MPSVVIQLATGLAQVTAAVRVDRVQLASTADPHVVGMRLDVHLTLLC